MKINGYLLKSTVVAALGGLLFGFDTAVIAGTTSNLVHVYSLPQWLSWAVGMLHTSDPSLLKGITVSSALIGTIFGAMFGGLPGDRYGRRDSLRVMAVLYFVSAVGCAFAWSWYALVFFRFLGGLGIGGSSVLGPMYIAEIAPANWRGRLVGFFQFNVVSGILIAYLSNYLVGLQQFGVDAEWRWKLGVSAIPAALFFLMLFAIPRSPRWLVKKQRVAEARDVLRLTGEQNYEQELQDIVESIDAEHGLGDEPLFQHKYRLPIFLAVSIAMFNQLAGINAILYYLNDIFAYAGFNKVSSDLQAVAVGFTNLVFTVIAMSVIDKVGRKTLLLTGAVGTALCLGGVAAIFATSQRYDRDLGLYQRGVSQPRAGQGSEPGLPDALAHECRDFFCIPDTGCVVEVDSLHVLFRDDGGAVPGGPGCVSGDEGRFAGRDAEETYSGMIGNGWSRSAPP
jgi:SP family arabinose:H+ symporter-like MFS transporter